MGITRQFTIGSRLDIMYLPKISWPGVAFNVKFVEALIVHDIYEIIYPYVSV